MKFKAVQYEEHRWHSAIDVDMLSRRQRKTIVDKYNAALPCKIEKADFSVNSELQAEIDDALILATRFDEMLKSKGYSIPAIMLRSESASSSQIENLTASAKNIAIAELDSKAPKNSRIIADNISAMKTALSLDSEISLDLIVDIHKTLLHKTNTNIAGKIREQQVWIGGSDIKEITAGIIFAVQVGCSMAAKIDDMINTWKLNIRAKGSSNVWKLIDVLVENPVVDAKFVSKKLNLSLKSAYNILQNACNFSVLKPIEKENQNMKFEAQGITDLIDEIMSNAKMRRSK